MSLASMAMSVPFGIETPTSAWARAGASLIPSPTIATTLPALCSARISLTFSCGSTWATTRLIPVAFATASAVDCRSPLSSTTSIPRFASSSTASRDEGLTASSTTMIPATLPSIATNSSVLPTAAAEVTAFWAAATSTSSSRINCALPTATSRPVTTPVTPLPVCDRKPLTHSNWTPREPAARTIAVATGCSECRSSDAAALSTASSWAGGIAITSPTAGTPSVTVPVLSNTTVFTSPARCRISPPLISNPSSAPRPVATITAVGTASPIAQGHAMMSTETAAAIARGKAALPARKYQPTNVTTAIVTTTGTNTALTLSARCCIGARELCASRINFTMRARTLSSPTLVAR